MRPREESLGVVIVFVFLTWTTWMLSVPTRDVPMEKVLALVVFFAEGLSSVAGMEVSVADRSDCDIFYVIVGFE